MSNLLTWSASAPWTDEISGERRLVSSDTGDGWDAARILLPDVVDHLTRELGPRADPHRPARAPSARGRLAAPERRRVRRAVRRLRARDLGRCR